MSEKCPDKYRHAPPEVRFWRYVDKSHGPNGDCWAWIGGKKSVTDPQHSYGRFNAGNGKRTYAHIWSFENAHGPVGKLWVLHRCNNPECVNPDHLYLGTQRENMADAARAGSMSRRPQNFKKGNYYGRSTRS